MIAPLALVLAGTLIAAGGGLDGLASLGEVASGPPLPDIGLERTPAVSLGRDSGTAATAGAAAIAPAPTAGPRGATDAPAGPARAPARVTQVSPPRRSPPATDGARPAPNAPPATPQDPSGGGTPAPVPPSPAPIAPAPGQDLVDPARDLIDSLPAPVQPLGGGLLDTLNPRGIR